MAGIRNRLNQLHISRWVSRAREAVRTYPRLWKALRTLLLMLIVLLSGHLLFPPPPLPDYSFTITDSQNRLLHAYLTRDEQWRMKTGLEDISPLLKKTILYKEDRWFYYHPGVNPVAILRALVKNVWRGRVTSGASTITMQVVRMLEPRPRTVWSKCVEACRALQLEWTYSKSEILQLYLNLVPMGGNIQGIKTAAWLYFDKSPDHLSLAEITALSIIPNRPVSLRIGKTNDRIVQERNKWLLRFGEAGLFDSLLVRDALLEPLDAWRRAVPRLAPHLSQKLRYRGDDQITTTLELEAQLKTEKIVTDYLRPYQSYNIRHAAVVVINNKTHTVAAYVGSGNFKDTLDGGQVNGAAAVRQPGSTLKPLLYGLCMDAGLITPKMKISDVASSFAGYVPENYDRKFNGEVTLEYALAHSLNIPAVKMLNRLGLPPMIKALSDCQFRQIQRDEKKLGLSLVLGGCGTTLEELTGLFSMFANEGLYIEPRYCKTDSTPRAKRVLSAGAAYLLTDMLSNIQRPDFPLHWQATGAMPRIAWKTGTSYGRRDAWSIGYNRHYTIGVWLGNFSGQGIPELSGASVATPLLFRIFNTLDYDSDKAWYQWPPGLDSRIVCSESGLPPESHCDQLVTDFFIPLVSPAGRCTIGQEYLLSADEKTSYCRECAPEGGYKKKWLKPPSPELQAYYESSNIAYQKVPPHFSGCQKVFRGNGPVITSPDNGAEYFLEKSDPEPLMLKCSAETDITQVYWYINDVFYRSAEPGDAVFYMPAPGPQKISCTDDKGRNRNIRILVTMTD